MHQCSILHDIPFLLFLSFFFVFLVFLIFCTATCSHPASPCMPNRGKGNPSRSLSLSLFLSWLPYRHLSVGITNLMRYMPCTTIRSKQGLLLLRVRVPFISLSLPPLEGRQKREEKKIGRPNLGRRAERLVGRNWNRSRGSRISRLCKGVCVRVLLAGNVALGGAKTSNVNRDHGISYGYR